MARQGRAQREEGSGAPFRLAPPSTAEAVFRSLVRPPAPDTAEPHLRRYIVEHGLRPGDKLPSEAELSASIGSSRLVVREGLRSLEALGLLDSRAGSGWFVRPFDVSTAAGIFARSLAFHPAALLDLLEVRSWVEGEAAVKAAGAITAHDVGVLDGLVDRMRWRATRGEGFRAEDSEFHRRIAAAAGNLMALALIDLYCHAVESLYEHGFPRLAPAELPATAEAHAGLLAALRHGEASEIVRAFRAHHEPAQRVVGGWLAGQDPSGNIGTTDSAEVSAPEGRAEVRAAAQGAVQAALLWRAPERL
jgi:DNA-binding FadR family transcriptional regulator